MDVSLPNSEASKDLVQLVTLEPKVLLHSRHVGIVDVVPVKL